MCSPINPAGLKRQVHQKEDGEQEGQQRDEKITGPPVAFEQILKRSDPAHLVLRIFKRPRAALTARGGEDY
ncbi:MAG: hypothetical protein P8X77_17770 [Maritimibacter sp.]